MSNLPGEIKVILPADRVEDDALTEPVERRRIRPIDNFGPIRGFMQPLSPPKPIEPDDGDLEILCGPRSYKIPKVLLRSKVPYFKTLLSSNLKEAKENKVTLNLDDESFDLIVHWLYYDFAPLDFQSVTLVNECADYLGILKLKEICSIFLQLSFTLNDLPHLLEHITPTCTLINTEQMNFFLAANLSLIVASNIFLTFPVHVLDYLVQLQITYQNEDFMVDMVIKWVTHELESRRQHLESLLKQIRWQFVSDEKMADLRTDPTLLQLRIPSTVFHSIENFPDIRRNHVPVTISLLQYARTRIRMFVRTPHQTWIFACFFDQDNTISLNAFHGDENTIDVIYDSGRQGVRINLQKRTYRFYTMIGEGPSYFGQKYRYLLSSMDIKPAMYGMWSYHCKPLDLVCDTDSFSRTTGVLEAQGQFLSIKTNGYRVTITYPYHGKTWYQDRFSRLVHSIDINETTYMLEKSWNLHVFNRKTKQFRMAKIPPDKDEDIMFSDIILTTFDDRELCITEKENGRMYNIDLVSKKWLFIGHMAREEPLITIVRLPLPKFFEL